MTVDTTYPTILRTRRLKMAFVFVVSLIFVAIGVSMIRSNGTQWGLPAAYWGWFAVIVFGLGMLVSVVSLLPGASYLQLTDDGFTTCALFRRSFTPWSAVHGFGVSQIVARKMVGVNFEPTVAAATRGTRMNTKLVGFDGALPDTYGMSADALAELMNRALAKARLRTG